MHDDAHSVARLVGHPTSPLDHDDAVAALSTRLAAGWAAYVFDMDRLVVGTQVGGAVGT